MSLRYDRCPRCSKDFEDCPCSLGQVEAYLENKKLRKMVAEEVKKALAKQNKK